MPSGDNSSTSTPTLTDQEKISCAFFTFTDVAGISKARWKKPFSSYKEGTKKKKGGVARKVVDVVLNEMAPGHKEELRKAMHGRATHGPDFMYESPFEDVMEMVNHLFLTAPTRRERDFVLSIVAGRVDYPILHHFIPSLSLSKFKRAQDIALSDEFYEIKKSTILEEYDAEGVSEFIGFITRFSR